jgi:hypothetical protein
MSVARPIWRRSPPKPSSRPCVYCTSRALNERDAAHLALETAESQLAAVREVVRKYEFGYGITPPMLALKKALTPAPSPGAVGGK